MEPTRCAPIDARRVTGIFSGFDGHLAACPIALLERGILPPLRSGCREADAALRARKIREELPCRLEGDRATCRLVDDNLKAEFHLSFDRGFRELVVYTPPRDDDVIALEPYTQTTDAVNLAARNVDGGLRVLGHGATESFTIVMETVG